MTDAATAGLRARGTPAWPRFGHRLRGLIGGIGLAAAAAAQAAPANYQCTGYLPLKAEFTPRKAQVHFRDDDWELLRVRDSHEAMYVNRRAGVTVTVNKGAMVLAHGGQTWQCKLLTNALRPENLGVPPASAPAHR